MARASALKRSGRSHWLSAYTQFDRNVYLLLLFTLGKGFQLSIGALSINLYAYSLGYRSDFIGLLTAMPALGSLLAAVPIGICADRMGRKPLLLLSGLLNPLALVAVALSTSAPLLLAAGLLNGLLSSAYWVTNLPLLTENSRDDQRVSVLAMNSFLMLGVGSLGALIGGAVPELVGSLLHQPATATVPLRWGVLVAAIIVFLPAPPLFWLRERPRASLLAGTAASPARAASVPPEPLGDLPQAPAIAEDVTGEPADPVGRKALAALFVRLLLPDMLFTTGEGATVGLLQIYFLLRFHIQPGEIGVLYTVAGICGGATALTAPRLVRRWGKLRTATTMQYLSVPTVLLIGFAPFFPLAGVGEFGRNVWRGFFEPTYAAFAMERVSTRYRATLSGFYSVTWSIGYSIGPTLAGWLQVHVGLSAGFVLSAVCIALAATLLRSFFPLRAELA